MTPDLNWVGKRCCNSDFQDDDKATANATGSALKVDSNAGCNGKSALLLQISDLHRAFSGPDEDLGVRVGYDYWGS